MTSLPRLKRSTAPPAAGKTCLMSQLVVHTLEHEGGGGLVPILVKVQQLQRAMLENLYRDLIETPGYGDEPETLGMLGLTAAEATRRRR